MNKFSTLIILSLVLIFLGISCQETSTPELMVRYENNPLRPYEIFGDSSSIILTESEQDEEYKLIIFNENKSKEWSKLELEFKTGLAKMYDHNSIVIDTFIVPPQSFARFLSMDKLDHKYPNLNPYNYVANSPIKNIDPDGDSIAVAQKYRDYFNQALQSVFGQVANQFSYTNTGMLKFDGDPKDLPKKERALLKKIDKTMTEEMVTEFVYKTTFELTDNRGNKTTLTSAEAGGEMTLLAQESNGLLTKNYVIVDPNSTMKGIIYETLPAYYTEEPPSISHPHFNPNEIETSRETRTFHGLGHVIYGGKSQDKVIDFDNQARSLNKIQNPDGTFTAEPLSKRKYDQTHNNKEDKIKFTNE